MTSKIVVGLDGSEGASPASLYAKKLAGLIGSCELILVYVIEWSPYTFLTPEENEERHKRREVEIETAKTRILNPAVENFSGDGHTVRGIVKHGNVADLLERIASEEDAELIVVNRTSSTSITSRIFGSSTANLVMHASVPVLVVG